MSSLPCPTTEAKGAEILIRLAGEFTSIIRPGIRDFKLKISIFAIILINFILIPGAYSLDYPPNFQFIKVENPISPENTTYPLQMIPVPDVGISFFEPHFKTIITRATTTDGIKGRHEYSRFDPFNVDQTLILLDPSELWNIYKTDKYPYNDKSYLFKTVNLEEMRWDPVSPDIIWGVDGFEIIKVNLKTDETTTVKDFAQDQIMGPIINSSNVYRITMKDEGEASMDFRYWAFILQGNDVMDYNPQYIFTWDRTLDKIIGVYKVQPNEAYIDWVGMSTKGNWVIIGGLDYNGGNLVGLTMANKELTYFHRLDFSTAHSDVGLDVNGNEVIVMQNVRTDYIDLIPIDTATSPILEAGGSYGGTNRTPIARLYYDNESPFGLQSGVHISCNYPGYALISTSIDPGLPEQNWLDRSIIIVKLDPQKPQAFYLAKVYGIDEAYWEETHGSISRDGKRVVWATNWGQNVGQEQVFLMELKMPPNWDKKINGSLFIYY